MLPWFFGETPTPLGLIALLLFLTFWTLYLHLTRHYEFWSRQGVPCKKPVFPFGSLKELVILRKPLQEVYGQVYKQFPDERFFGVVHLHEPILVVRDPDIIKDIMIKNFNCFVDRVPFARNPNEWLSNHLFLMDGEEWRNMRQRLSPAFSSGKMKNMFTLMVKCSEQLGDYLESLTETQSSVNVKGILAKFTMDVIATCAFGVEINSLKDEETEFYKMGTSIFKPSKKVIINHFILSVFPTLGEKLNVQRLGTLPKKMLYKMIRDTVNYREKNKYSRNDFIDTLINIRQNKSILDGTEDEIDIQQQLNDSKSKLNGNEGLTLQQMTAQAFIFFVAGFETSSSVATFCLYELARNKEVQHRLLREIQEVLAKHDGQLTYQSLQEMKYLDQVINETLRMYASLGVLHRRCVRPYRVPDSSLVLQPGQRVFIPIHAIHHDPQYYPDPYSFDPDRFTPENTAGRHSCVYLPFGTGPRNCIGMRFGLMQTRIAVATVIKEFEVDVAPETPSPIPLQPTGIVTQPRMPVYLRATNRRSTKCN